MIEATKTPATIEKKQLHLLTLPFVIATIANNKSAGHDIIALTASGFENQRRTTVLRTSSGRSQRTTALNEKINTFGFDRNLPTILKHQKSSMHA